MVAYVQVCRVLNEKIGCANKTSRKTRSCKQRQEIKFFIRKRKNRLVTSDKTCNAKEGFFVCAKKLGNANRFVSFLTPYTCSPPRRLGGLGPGRFFPSMPLRTHPNSPYHAFGFEALRQITFENQVTKPGGIYLRAGSKQAELFVIPLLGPSQYTSPSRYHGQEGATLMRTTEKRPAPYVS